jgi:RNase H-fold protein (predicted Holliday junction resolvase)
MKVLTMPAKVASSLDWRKLGGALLTLDIHSDRIGVAVAHHPSRGERCHTFESLPLEKKGRSIPDQTKRRLAELCSEHNVCGIVVSWPVQQDTGKLGFAAGRTLWTIEQLLQQGNILTPNRPLCLWDGVHAKQPPIDDWGRSAAYARTSDKTYHLASQEQYHQEENVVAAQVWKDFMKTNWPDIYYEQPPEVDYQMGPSNNSSNPKNTSNNGGDIWDDVYSHQSSNSPYMQMAF